MNQCHILVNIFKKAGKKIFVGSLSPQEKIGRFRMKRKSMSQKKLLFKVFCIQALYSGAVRHCEKRQRSIYWIKMSKLMTMFPATHATASSSFTHEQDCTNKMFNNITVLNSDFTHGCLISAMSALQASHKPGASVHVVHSPPNFINTCCYLGTFRHPTQCLGSRETMMEEL